MRFKDKETWDKGLANQQDDYGVAGYKFAQSWAELMEEAIDRGEKLEDVAKNLSHKAAVEGISGFQYGLAVELLSQVWEHGEELRRWHNLDTQVKNEGDKANENGGVLNPALVVLKSE